MKRLFGLSRNHHDKPKKEKKATIIAPDSGAVSIGDNVFEVMVKKVLFFRCLVSCLFSSAQQLFQLKHDFLIHQQNISSLLLKHPVRNFKSVVIKFNNALFLYHLLLSKILTNLGRVRKLKFLRLVKLDITSLSWKFRLFLVNQKARF